MKVLLIGAGGQLATDISRLWTHHEVVARSHQELEICDAAAVNEAVAQVGPDCIVNTAAFHRVDACEDEVAAAFQVNVAGVANLARAAQEAGATLVQFSTDYVFDGAKHTPYVESDKAHPISTYGMSRLAGEWAVCHYCERAYVVRTCGLYGLAGRTNRTGNFVETMLKLARTGKSIRVVSDQIVTPTSTQDLAAKTAELLAAGAPFGTYHMTNTGECSWYEFACEIFRLAGMKADLAPTTGAEFGAKAKRPAYSVLDNAAMRAVGLGEFRDWHEALADYAEQ